MITKKPKAHLFVKTIFDLANLSSRTKDQTPINNALAFIIYSMGAWVGARCILDSSLKDKTFLALNVGFFAFLVWRGWIVMKANSVRRNEFPLLLLTLAWTTWMAHRGIDFFQWWLPLAVLIMLIASIELIFPVLSVVLVLVAIMLMLDEHFDRATELLGSTFVVLASIGIYRRFKDDLQNRTDRRIHDLQIAQNAAGFWYMELVDEDRIDYISNSLLEKLGLSDISEKILISDIFHPGDYLTVDKARLSAVRLSEGKVDVATTCDCRLIKKTGGSMWVQAQFFRTNGVDVRLVVALKSIEDRLRLEDIVRDNQRRLASQAIEISTQFDAAKSALHARQEVERLAQHDLRSPLKSIESAAALLRKGRLLSNTEENLLTSIERTAARALSMVTMSLDLYRMEEGTFRFVPEKIDLVVIVRNVIGELANHARSKNVHLEFDASISKLEAIGNGLLTTSVIENLVRNALEAAPEYSTVTIALYQGARVGLLIHNQGMVHHSIRNDFFKKYATHGKHGGSGLGTYSARLIARAQGGDLTMTTSAERGTLLIFKLNRCDNELFKEKENRSASNSFGPSLPGNLFDIPPSSELQSKQTPIELLVVEDDDYNWVLLLSWLPKHVGARRAINGREAVEALTVRRPDIVVMDIEMPVMDGFEALHRIREMQASVSEEPSLIYAFTGYDDIETTKKIEAAGFDGILKKPAAQRNFEEILENISLRTDANQSEDKPWIEKHFISAFPTFIESRRALVDDIERSAEAGDIITMRRAAHTLAGSPAIHGFHEGISICEEIFRMKGVDDLYSIKDLVSRLKKILSNPSIR